MNYCELERESKRTSIYRTYFQEVLELVPYGIHTSVKESILVSCSYGIEKLCFAFELRKNYNIKSRKLNQIRNVMFILLPLHPVGIKPTLRSAKRKTKRRINIAKNYHRNGRSYTYKQLRAN